MRDLNQRIQALDVSRLVAAIFVVLFHISSGTNGVFNLGYLSVDYFFVLSGFVLARNLLRIQSLSESLFFVKKRFFRLLPNTAVSIIFIFVITGSVWVFGSKDSVMWQNFNLTSIIGYLSLMSIFVSQSIALNYPVWSLSSEFVSNILLAFLRLGARSLRFRMSLLYAFPLSYIFTSLVSITPASVNSWVDPLIRTCSGVAIGCLLFQHFPKLSNPIIKSNLLIVSVGLLIYGELEIGFQIISCLIIKVLIENSERLENCFHRSILRDSGELSFLIYLLHVPLLNCVDLLQLKTNLLDSTELYIQGPLRVIIVLVLTFLILKIRSAVSSLVRNK
jgi:peptidoglycan/LPS O-acetylase OafA/YrhL